MTWQKVVERKGQSVLISSYFYNGIQTKYFEEILAFPFGLNKYLIIDYVNYYDKEEVEKFKKEVGKLLEETHFLFLKKEFTIFYKKGKDFIALSERIEKLKEKEREEG